MSRAKKKHSRKPAAKAIAHTISRERSSTRWSIRGGAGGLDLGPVGREAHERT